MGLGVLGGGVATARALVERGAELTVTDLKDTEYLKDSLEKLRGLDIRFVLGGHKENDFLETEILVINPDVPANNHFVEIARATGKQIENELTLFYKFAPCKNIVGITGTRGKTTTTNWIGHILKFAGKKEQVLGNDPEKPFLSEISKCTEDTIAVIETPSFQLEIFGDSGFAPHIALITNLYQDHLSRHKTMEEYAQVKADIFKNQTERDFLILNKDNDWTNFFLRLKPKSKVIFSCDIDLPGFNMEEFSRKYGEHNLSNFFDAASACLLLGVPKEQILQSIESLPKIKFREELVYSENGLEIYNDSAATSPEATVAALKRFSLGNKELILISGGTDRDLDFKNWATMVAKYLKPENLVLLSGSATEKMKKELTWEVVEQDSLKECFDWALDKTKSKDSIILFSPSSKSFTKFKNEFDRGEKFNQLVQNLVR